MPKGIKKKPVGGQPRHWTKAEIKQIEDLAYKGCKTNTIATVLGVDYDILVRNHKERMAKKRCEGKIWLRERQLETAQKNPVMQIWLGKNTLDQSDKQETKLSGQVELKAPIIT